MDRRPESGSPRLTGHTQKPHAAMEQEPAEETETQTQGGLITDPLFLYVSTVGAHGPSGIACNVINIGVKPDVCKVFFLSVKQSLIKMLDFTV